MKERYEKWRDWISWTLFKRKANPLTNKRGAERIVVDPFEAFKLLQNGFRVGKPYRRLSEPSDDLNVF